MDEMSIYFDPSRQQMHSVFATTDPDFRGCYHLVLAIKDLYEDSFTIHGLLACPGRPHSHAVVEMDTEEYRQFVNDCLVASSNNYVSFDCSNMSHKEVERLISSGLLVKPGVGKPLNPYLRGGGIV